MEGLEPLRRYIHAFFPRLSDANIRKNDLEIDYALRFARNCETCLGLDHCPNRTRGLAITPLKLSTAGFIEWNMINCRYDPDWRYRPAR